jgi:predicted membrane protein
MTKLGYALILIGLALLAANYGLIDYSIFYHDLALPIMLIIAGAFSIIKSVFKENDFLSAMSPIIGILTFIIIFINIFSIPLFFLPANATPIISLSQAGIESSFSSLNFSSNATSAIINYESTEKSSDYSTNYSIKNSFGEGYYDLGSFSLDNLLVENNFGKSSIINLNDFETAILENNFGDLEIATGAIEKSIELYVENNFGSALIIIDADAEYEIITKNSLGSIKNNVGLKSSGYDSAIYRIKLVVENAFGSVEIAKR